MAKLIASTRPRMRIRNFWLLTVNYMQFFFICADYSSLPPTKMSASSGPGIGSGQDLPLAAGMSRARRCLSPVAFIYCCEFLPNKIKIVDLYRSQSFWPNTWKHWQALRYPRWIKENFALFEDFSDFRTLILVNWFV